MGHNVMELLSNKELSGQDEKRYRNKMMKWGNATVQPYVRTN